MKSDVVKLALLAAVLVAAGCAEAQDRQIDLERSTITIHAGKAGLFSAAGHDHWINAPIASGVFSESGAQHVEFVVETAKMTVKPDPNVDAKTQMQIQKDMEEMTMETRKFPRITFQSERVERAAAGWKVQGALSLHGVTKSITLNVTKDGEAFVSKTTLKQTDYGIKPVSVGGGMVKVKDQVEIEIRIVPQG